MMLYQKLKKISNRMLPHNCSFTHAAECNLATNYATTSTKSNLLKPYTETRIPPLNHSSSL